MTQRLRMNTFLAAASLLAAACAATTPKTGSPARLASGDDASLVALKAALADATGVRRVELGPGDVTTQSSIAVLPPRPGLQEARSLARPTMFDLVIDGGACRLVRREDGAVFAAPGVRCLAL